MFIDVLEKELKARNLTMNKLAKGAGLAQSPTSRWKQGNSLPSAEALIKICKYLNVSADYLLELEPPPDISDRERRLLEYYRRADPRGQDYIMETAEREATRAIPEEKLSESKIG